jgi:[ribosomal protein S5]-alanine N-acetyltransferase
MIETKSKVEITTPRLFLREFQPNDLNSVHIFASDPEVTKHSSWGPNSIDETQSWLNENIEAQTASPRLIYEWAITKIGSADVIGTCRLGIKSLDNREGYIGYTITKNEWGKGYATELSNAVLQYGFKNLQLHRIYATASPDNIPSHRVLEKSGMVREGILRKNILQRGQWRDSVIYSILEEEWI